MQKVKFIMPRRTNSDEREIDCCSKPVTSRQSEKGLTLLELLVVISIIAILAGLLLPGLIRSKQKGMTGRCTSNLRQLQVAWQLYADEFEGACIPNDSRRTNGVYRGFPDSWAGENNAAVDTTDELLAQGLFVRLGLIQGTAIFRCPADRSTAKGVPRTRSYSLNAHFAGATNAVGSPFYRTDEVKTPSEAFVAIDELEETIDDGHFLVYRAPDTRWTNLPADRHEGGAVLSFADGHVEHWIWKSSKHYKPEKNTFWMQSTEADLPDLRRLQAALPERK